MNTLIIGALLWLCPPLGLLVWLIARNLNPPVMAYAADTGAPLGVIETYDRERGLIYTSEGVFSDDEIIVEDNP